MPAMPNLEPLVLRVGERDNVVTALRDILPGDYLLAGAPFAVREFIPMGHKLAALAIAPGQTVVKYDSPIGVARADIPAGVWVHIHNLVSIRSSKQPEESVR